MVSVILSVLNGVHTIKDSIESVCAQTYGDWELLVVDNGSTDGTMEFCQAYEKRDSRIRVLCCTERGVVSARKLGLKEANGKYIAFLDADDAYTPDMLFKMEQAAKLHHADIVSCGYIDVHSDGKQEYCFPDAEGVVSADIFFNCLFESGTMGFLCNKLYRKDVLEHCKQPENMEVCEDTFINCSLMRNSRKIVVLKECLYRYTVNLSSVTHTLSKKIDSEGNWKYLTSYRKIKELFIDDPLKTYRIQKAEWWIIKLGVEELAAAGTDGKFAKKKLVNEMRKSIIKVLLSDENIRFKLSYLKCWLLKH